MRSRAIRAVVHDPLSKRLRVELQSGSVYEYPDVSVAEAQALLQAPSWGKHYVAHIRSRPGVKVR